jgi:transposase
LKNTEQKKYCKSCATKSALIIETIHSSLKNDPFLSIRNLSKIIETVNDIKVSRELVRTSIKRLGYSKKKARFFSAPKNLMEKTKAFIERRELYKSEGRVFISIDETSFGRHGRDMKGYSPKGKRLRLQRTIPNRVTVSSLVAITDSRIVKRQELKGSFNSDLFSKFILDLPMPEGTVILLDNVSFHHSIIVREAVKTKGFEMLFTPPYSPWFNPIEGVFSIIKRNFYQNGCINTAFDAVNEEHCKAFFNKSQNLFKEE